MRTKYIPESAELDDVVMTGDELMDATQSVVRTFSSDYETDCIFSGDGAFTDGDTVVLPSVPCDAEVTARQAHVIGGYANHETLHKLLTDFRSFRKWAKDKGAMTKAMNNAIEDVRIEKGGKKLYNGIAKQIDKTAREVNRTFIDEVYPEDPSIVEDFGKIGAVAVTWAGRKLLGYPDPSNEEALSLLPDDIRKRVERIAEQAMKLDDGCRGMGNVDKRGAYNGCRKAMKLAERIVKDYMDEIEQEQEPEQGNEQGNGEGSDGEGQSNDQRQGDQGEGDANGQGGHEQDDEGNASGQQGEESGGEMGGDDEANGSTDSDQSNPDGQGATPQEGEVERQEPEAIDPTLEGAVNKVSGEINSDHKSYRVFAPSADEVINVRGSKHHRELYNRALREAGSSLSTIRRKLERVLLEIKQTLWENGARSGRLDVRRNAAKIVQYNRNVFRRKEDETSINSALMILCDQSGSMGGTKNWTATQATIAICEALEPTGVPIEVIGHYTIMPNGKAGRMLRKHEHRRAKYGRLEAIRYYIYKSFDEQLSQARSGLGMMGVTTGGANADGDAVRFAAKRLLQRPEPRKIMFVLSDGRPAWNSETHDEDQWTRDCAQWCIERDIELVGIGIKDKSVKKYYPDFIVIKDLSEFATKYMSKVAQILLGQKTKDKDLMKTGVRRATKF